MPKSRNRRKKPTARKVKLVPQAIDAINRQRDISRNGRPRSPNIT
jgi:hypothetical protein